MDVPRICRCCLAEGLHKDLEIPYIFLGKKEVYCNMLLECFNIVMMPSYNTAICDNCISMVRSALDFRTQVLEAEERLQKGKEQLSDLKEHLEIKVEPKQDSDFSESDDYFLADTVKEVPIYSIKTENKEPVRKKISSKATKLKKPKAEAWTDSKVKNILARLTPSIDSCELTIKRKNPRKLTRTIQDPTKINVSWTSEKFNDKFKLKDNFITILRYSNALPFKNKSLLGFICAYCDAAFPDPANLRNHVDEDHKKDRLKLKFKKALSEYSLKLDITGLRCTVCDEELENLTILKDHLVKTHDKIIHSDVKDLMMQFKLKKGEVYDCAMCSSTYETFKTLKQHMNLHYCNYSCTKCEASFATKRSLTAHLHTHQEGSHKCDYCEKVFSSRSKKHYHHKMKHLGARNISNCPYCNESFRSYYQRNQHLVKIHNTEAQYKCNVCSRVFILKSLLMYHIKKNHLMERNAQCAECGYKFFSKKALKAHMVKHTGERKYACEMCHKSYARKYTLREHMRIHYNDRRFKCEVCAMTFVQKCSLKSHLLSNHGISLAASEISSVEIPIAT